MPRACIIAVEPARLDLAGAGGANDRRLKASGARDLDTLAILLVLASTFAHAGWNLLAKRAGSQLDFFNRMLLFVTLVGFLPWILGQALAGMLIPKVWLCAVGGGICGGVYCIGLGLAYEREDFTLVYPVARALPVLMLGVFDVLRLRDPSFWGWAGMGLVACGCFLAPLRTWDDVALNKYINRASLGMLLASLGTVGYSVIDKIAAESLPRGPTSAAIYGYILFVMIWATFAGTLNVARMPRPPSKPAGWFTLVPAAAMCFGAYWLVLWAYQIAPRVSYVVAFRQFSIVIGVVLAILILKERLRLVRMLATALIVAGLALIALRG
jgi:drug/metabolite transporter (DMT)-like permease